MLRFHDRMKMMSRLSGTCEMSSYGIDVNGTAFAVFPVFDGHAISASVQTFPEAERRMLACLRIVERLHQMSIVCGDLSTGSFWLDREGNVKFVGVIGADRGIEPEELNRLAPDLATFLSPEQKRGESPTTASDIYSIGVITYALFYRELPRFSDQGSIIVAATSSSGEVTPPEWVEGIVARCCSVEPSVRFASITQLLEAISEARIAMKTRAEMPVIIEPVSRGNSQDGVRQIIVSPRKASGASRTTKAEVPVASVFRSKLLRYTVAGCVIGGLTLAAAQMVAKPKPVVPVVPKRDSAVGADGSAIDGSEQKYFDELVLSDDPLAHEDLIRTAREAKVPSRRQMAERALLERTKRLTLVRSSDQIKAWLAGIDASKQPQGYEQMLRSIDPAMPLDHRSKLLKTLYLTYPQVTTRVVAALALDTRDFAGYRDVLAPLVGDLTRQPDASSHATLSLILGTPDLSNLFAEDVHSSVEEIPDADVSWLLEQLGTRGDTNTRFVAQLALTRNLFSPARRVFLELVKKRSDLPKGVLAALVRAATGTLSVGDIGAFGVWYDLDAVEALFAIAVDSPDQPTRVAAFDTLGSKSVSDSCIAGLLDWVKRKKWDERHLYAKAIGTLALHNIFSPSEIREALAVFDKEVRNRDLLRVLLQSDTPAVMEGIMSRYATILEPTTLIELLRHSDPGVRRSAIRALKSSNDVGVLKMVLDAYAVEKDPEVRAEYEKEMAVIRERAVNRP
jgi:hypothetical protein